MSGMGGKENYMYHYIQDKDYLKRLKGTCSDIVNQLVQNINNDSVMSVNANLVGSGAKNLITQNESNPIDLDYNLCIVDVESISIGNGAMIKEYVRKQFNKILMKNGWGDCQDSTSALTTGKMFFKRGNKTAFSIDLAITCKFNNGWNRLIHKKTGFVEFDRYFWNEVPDTGQMEKKVHDIKLNHLWNEVRETYLYKKNLYLRRNDYTHPSFIIYVETINQIYKKMFY